MALASHPFPTPSLNNMVPDMGTGHQTTRNWLAGGSGEGAADADKSDSLQQSSSFREANWHFPPAAHSSSAAAPPLTFSTGGIEYVFTHPPFLVHAAASCAADEARRRQHLTLPMQSQRMQNTLKSRYDTPLRGRRARPLELLSS